MSKTKVVVVDDSALVRSLLTAIISRQPDMEIVGAASDPYVAREVIRTTNPDVVTLDVEMPRMDGLDFLEKIMRLRPLPVVMISTLTERGAEVTLKALELGAVDFVTKPKLGISEGLERAGAEIIEKIRIASRARVSRRAPAQATAAFGAAHVLPGSQVAGTVKQSPSTFSRASTEKLIVIGASTGGTEALKSVLIKLPPDSPGVLVTQHMPAGFTRSFAQRLDGLCRIRVSEAVDGERVLPGHAYIAPGGRHMRLDRSGSNYVVRLDDTEPVNRHRPSVEVLFRSAASNVGPNAIGIMLTGMGRDGADAMKLMRDAGAYNYAQNEATCVVYGMPREAVAAGAVDEVLPLDQIAEAVLERLRASGGLGNRV
ncbi:MAG TPA: chemotaxis response regulator protein-glutamate methylesterase [Burkholderiaceae bacterium]|nr:chemotaxis response regulator protein-glutamate methylesterase [Burkholderiaceae bacterium]